MADLIADALDAPLYLDLDAAVRRVEMTLNGMPYGGTYFYTPEADRSAPVIDRLDATTKRLTQLAEGLREHATEVRLEHEELMELRRQRSAVRMFMGTESDGTGA